MTLYEKLRDKKTTLKEKIELIKEKNKEKTMRLNLKRIGL